MKQCICANLLLSMVGSSNSLLMSLKNVGKSLFFIFARQKLLASSFRLFRHQLWFAVELEAYFDGH